MEYELKEHHEFSQLKQITIKTKPNYNKYETTMLKKASMTKDTADLLDNLAGYVANEGLATALRKLSRHGREK